MSIGFLKKLKKFLKDFFVDTIDYYYNIIDEPDSKTKIKNIKRTGVRETKSKNEN